LDACRTTVGGNRVSLLPTTNRVGILEHRVFTIRNGSCGDAILKADVPRIVRALEDLDLMADDTMIAVDDGLPVLPRRQVQDRGK
jgi:hypothetical protein